MNLQQLTFQKLDASDLSTLQGIGLETSYSAFKEMEGPQNTQNFLSKAISAEKIRNELENTYSQFYFAKTEKCIVGYLKINFRNAQTDLKDDQVIELERIYLLKEHRGKQLGRQLLRFAILMAKKNKTYNIFSYEFEK